ncbi:NAD(P)-dependent oxidoreductase [bacterium]|nr:NAD(P)-dependent oxidoreductase [bacterium]
MKALPELRGKKIVLIGGAGFIGHHLALELKRQGAEVSVIDGLQVNNLLSLHCETCTNAERNLYLAILNERIELLRNAGVPLYVEDARDYLRLSMLLGKLRSDAVVLLAAVAHASRSNKDPFHTFDHSFRTLENALDASRGRVKHFVYFSSSMVYGNFEADAVDETSSCNPLGIYGALKFGGEKLVIAYQQVFKMPYTIIRPSALYGERCISRRVGQVFIENALRGQDLVLKGDGKEKLDFTYIGDLVQGVCLCLANPASHNQVFNLTAGQGRSLNEMAEIVRSRHPKIKVHHIERDGLMPERGTLSVAKAGKLVGYQPSWPLEKGMVRYMDWYEGIFQRVKAMPHAPAEPQVNE